jgi:menaquinone-dependent protoporphyrinogen oxidase
LNECRLRFISVTPSLAGAERADATPDEHARFAAEVKKVIDAFFEQTGWRPNRVKPAAVLSSIRNTTFLIRFVMRRIARKAGAATDTSRDHEYTDWLALDRFINGWLVSS